MITVADILKARILIVDDQEANVALLAQMLSEAGYRHISSTHNPAEVCALHRKNPYDLILLDLQMPVMDGFQVMEGLKEIETGSYLPVLVLTAHPDHKLRALKAGAKDFVGKPFDLPEVLLRAHNLLEVRLLHLQAKKHSERLEATNQELTQALSEVKVLRGILPICCYCNKIRDNKDYWQSVENYISKHTDARFSHGYCPECVEKHVKPQLDELKRSENPRGKPRGIWSNPVQSRFRSGPGSAPVSGAGVGVPPTSPEILGETPRIACETQALPGPADPTKPFCWPAERGIGPAGNIRTLNAPDEGRKP